MAISSSDRFLHGFGTRKILGDEGNRTIILVQIERLTEYLLPWPMDNLLA
jgi:hypothetical protein